MTSWIQNRYLFGITVFAIVLIVAVVYLIGIENAGQPKSAILICQLREGDIASINYDAPLLEVRRQFSIAAEIRVLHSWLLNICNGTPTGRKKISSIAARNTLSVQLVSGETIEMMISNPPSKYMPNGIADSPGEVMVEHLMVVEIDGERFVVYQCPKLLVD